MSASTFDPGKKLKIKSYLYYLLAGCIIVLTVAVAAKYYKVINSLTLFGHHGSVTYFLLVMAIVIGLIVRKGKQLSQQSRFSSYGIKAEDESVAAALGLNWGAWKCWKDAGAYSGVGNIDMLITDPHGNPYNVEIKSWHKVKVLPNELRYADGNKMKKNPIEQAMRQKEFVEKAVGRKCTPILWLPKNKQGIDQYVGEVLVVSGSPKRLRDIIMKRFGRDS
ncbi:MAG: hypothetical protein CUN56_00605 [Phototrophicales bacterium]|nr:MAG: hypothetical protein CUN56_00605 [Phototrophicales bacterium]